MANEVTASEFPKPRSSGSGTEVGWSVEARYAFMRPEEIAGHLLDERWQTIEFAKCSPGCGVPTVPSFSKQREQSGLLSYPAAQALRWWLHAIADVDFKVCLETRLVRHDIRYQSECTAVSAFDVQTGRIPNATP